MTLFGRRDLWGIEVDPLPGPPEEPDPAAAATWCALRIWADGRNLAAHTRKGSSATSEAIHWPAAYLARWFVRSWPGFWERAGWPLPGTVIDAETACRRLDRRLSELGFDADEEFLDRRDAFVASHSLLAAAAGGLMPPVYLMREGATVHVSWRDLLGQDSDVAFHESRGHVGVKAGVFLDAVRGFLEWCKETARGRAPAFTEEIGQWLERSESPQAARAVLRGYLFPWGARDPSEITPEIETKMDLAGSWTAPGTLVNPARFSAAVVFRALTPVITTNDVLALLDRLRNYPSDTKAGSGLHRLSGELAVPSDAPPHAQGYALAEQFREALDNRDDFFDIEEFLELVGVSIDEIDLHDPSVDGATVWSAEHGPVILVNSQEHGTVPLWARRMTLAHELCHLLVDRSEASELMVASTPWAPPEIERRANAFAAELLLPKAGILRVAGRAVHRGWVGRETRNELMDQFSVGSQVCDHQLENRLDIDPQS